VINDLIFFQNILCKTTFPKQLEVLEVSENGLWAKVKAGTVGVGKVSSKKLFCFGNDLKC
jgi:hypothetical protein